MKERVTITINQQMLAAVDAQIDGTVVKNRSHAIELNLSKVLLKKELTQAVLLAGGTCTIPINGDEIPTTMARVDGKPILEHNLLLLKEQGITDFMITVGSFANQIKSHFGDGSRLGVSIKYLVEDIPLGTAGAIKKASSLISGTFLVCNGDELKSIDIKEMFSFHRKQATAATIAITTAMHPQEYGVVILNGNLVHSFIEKPKESIPTNLINAGLYIFEPTVFDLIPEGFSKLEVDVFPKIAKDDNCSGYVFYGSWQDICDEASLDEAKRSWHAHR